MDQQRLSTMQEPNHWDSCLMYRAGISDRPGMPIHTPIPSQSHVPILPFHHNRHQNVYTYDMDGRPLRCVVDRLNLLKDSVVSTKANPNLTASLAVAIAGGSLVNLGAPFQVMPKTAPASHLPDGSTQEAFVFTRYL